MLIQNLNSASVLSLVLNMVLFYFENFPPFFEKDSSLTRYSPGPNKLFLSVLNLFTEEKIAPFLFDSVRFSIYLVNELLLGLQNPGPGPYLVLILLMRSINSKEGTKSAPMLLIISFLFFEAFLIASLTFKAQLFFTFYFAPLIYLIDCNSELFDSFSVSFLRQYIWPFYKLDCCFGGSFYASNLRGLFENEKDGSFFLVLYKAFAGFYCKESSLMKAFSYSSKFSSFIILQGIEGFCSYVLKVLLRNSFGFERSFLKLQIISFLTQKYYPGPGPILSFS